MLSRTRLLPIVVFLSLAALTPSAHATLAQVMPFDDKVEHASSIIVGKCMATRSEWDADHRWILTYSTFKVEQSMKGSAPPEVTIVTPGGEAGGISQDTIGVPSFHKDDENVIFTKNTAHGPTVLYFDQGAYDVSESDRGDRIVTPRPTGAVLVDTQRGQAYEPERPRTLREFQHDVGASMERTRAQKMEMFRAREKKQDQSIGGVILKYKLLIALAIAGVAIATWQLLRR